MTNGYAIVLDPSEQDRTLTRSTLERGGWIALEATTVAMLRRLVAQTRPQLLVASKQLDESERDALDRHLADDPALAATPLVWYGAIAS